MNNLKNKNPEKIDLAKTLLSEGKTYKEIREIIGHKFRSGISETTLAELNKGIKNQSRRIEKELDLSIKNDLKVMIQLFYKANDLKKFVELQSDQEIDAITRLEALT